MEPLTDWFTVINWAMGEPADEENRKLTYDEATKRARGELGYPAPRIKAVGNLIGAPISDKLVHYAPSDEAAKLKDCAVLLSWRKKKSCSTTRITPSWHMTVWREQRRNRFRFPTFCITAFTIKRGLKR